MVNKFNQYGVHFKDLQWPEERFAFNWLGAKVCFKTESGAIMEGTVKSVWPEDLRVEVEWWDGLKHHLATMPYQSAKKVEEEQDHATPRN